MSLLARAGLAATALALAPGAARAQGPAGPLAAPGTVLAREGWEHDRVRFLPDRDGDGVAELAVGSHSGALCRLASAATVVLRSGDDLEVLSERSVDFFIDLELDGAGALLEVTRSREVELRVSEPRSGALRWERNLDSWVAGFAGDVDGDGRAEVAFGDVRARDRQGQRLGAR